jgi:hypothetical protein
MSQRFVPFLPGSAPAAPSPGAAAATAPSKVLSQPADAKRFVPAGPAPASTGASPSSPCGSPVVSLERDGDQVSRIRVQCGCGEVIVLDCLY